MISLGPWGGPGGQRWSSIATNGITEITINEQINIKSFSFTDASGVFSGTFGGRNPDSNAWGVERKVIYYICLRIYRSLYNLLNSINMCSILFRLASIGLQSI